MSAGFTSGRADVTITDVTIKTPDRKWPGTLMTSCPEAMGWGFRIRKKTVSWDSMLEEGSRFLIWARPDQGFTKCAACWLSQWVQCRRCTNSQHSKKLCLSLLMSENVKLKKVNKSFVPEPRKSSLFRVFSDSYMRTNIMNVLFLWISWSYFWTWICYNISVFERNNEAP